MSNLRSILFAAASLLACASALAQSNSAGPPLPSASPTPAAPLIPPASSGVQYYPVWRDATIANATVAPTQNTARCAPFFEPFAIHADQAAIYVSTLGTGPINFAIYSDAVDATTTKHQPQTLITNPNVTFTVTGTGGIVSALGTSGVGVAIPAGLNWACFNDTTATDAVRVYTPSITTTVTAGLVGALTVSMANSVANLSSLTVAETAGTTTTNWPSLVGVAMTESNVASVPALSLRVASAP